MTLPIDIQLPVTILTRVERAWFVVGIRSSVHDPIDALATDLSALTWTLSGLLPMYKQFADSGQSILLAFPAASAYKLNLQVESGGWSLVQCDFIGTDILDYLRSPATDFGELVVETDINHFPEALTGMAIGLALVASVVLS